MEKQKQLNAYNIQTKEFYFSNFTIYPMEYVTERRDADGRRTKQWLYLYSCVDAFGKTVMMSTDKVKMIKSKECVLRKCCRLRPKDENYYIKLNLHYELNPIEFIHGY